LGTGAPSLVTGNLGDDSASVLLNDGSGNFAPPVKYPVGSGPVRVVLADLNGDGFLDAVVSNYYSDSPGPISILYGNGDGPFEPAQTVNSGGNEPSAAGVGDFEGDAAADGLLDIAVSDTASDNVAVLLNSLAPHRMAPCPRALTGK